MFVFVQVSKKSSCKVADFGCSLNRSQLRAVESPFICGTPGYIAPEFIRGSLPTTKCDVFSLGIIIWQLMAKQPNPFPGISSDEIMYQVSRGLWQRFVLLRWREVLDLNPDWSLAKSVECPFVGCFLLTSLLLNVEYFFKYGPALASCLFFTVKLFTSMI